MTKKSVNQGGRPTKKEDAVVQKLEHWFHLDMYVETCCEYAGISKQTYYNWITNDDNLGKERTGKEEKVYRKQLKLYTSKLTALNEEMKEAKQNYDDLVETFEVVVNFFRNLGENLQDMNYVRTRYIFWIFSSNIIIDNKKKASHQVKTSVFGYLRQSILEWSGQSGAFRTYI